MPENHINLKQKEQGIQPDYIPGIDSFRALAVLAVIVYHMDVFTFLPGGFTGVDIFFVISGYVISKSLAKKSSFPFDGYLSEFYKRRILRIVPALLTCLLVTMLISTLFIPASGLSSRNGPTGLSAFFGLGNFSLVRNTNVYFSPKAELNPFLHTWSLGVEEQFYLFFPLLFLFWLKAREKGAVLRFISFGIFLGLTVASFVLSIFETGAHHDRAFYLLPYRFWELSAGALLFIAHSRRFCKPTSGLTANLLLVCGLIIAGSGFVFAEQNMFPFPWAVVPVAGTLLLLSGVAYFSDEQSPGRGFLQSRVPTYIGKISFSLYLWHWPVAVLLRWTVGFDHFVLKLIYLVLTFMLAITSYHCIEKPVRKSSFLLKQKNWKILVCGCAVIAASFFLAKQIDRSQPVISLSVTKDHYTWNSWRHEPREPYEVLENPEINGRRLFAVGDSHAAAYRTMFHEVSLQLGIKIYEFEQGGCAVAGLLKPMSKLDGCESFYRETLSELETLVQPGDIVFLASLRMPEFSDRFEVLDTSAVVAEFNNAEAVENRRLALEDAGRIIEVLSSLGAHVLIDAPKPVLKAPLFRCSDWFNKMNPIASQGIALDRDLLLEVRQPVMDSLSILQIRHPNLHVWDPFFILCDGEVCSAYDDHGLPKFFDGDHLSANGNRMLVPSFKETLISIWTE